MRVLNSHTTIGDFSFEWLNNLEIESGWEHSTDKGKIVLPKKVQIKNATGDVVAELSDYIKVGQKVLVRIGYDGVLNTVFSGYVSDFIPKTPLEILVEDEMWNLKQTTITGSAKNETVEGLMSKHFSAYISDVVNVSLGNYYIQGLSQAKILEQLKSDFGLYSFFRGDTLVVGKRYNSVTAATHIFQLGANVVSDDLVFKEKDQIKLKIKAISNNADGTKTEIEIGDIDGEERTLNFYNLSARELRLAADREKERLLYDGYRGSFTAFGEPFVKHGDIVVVNDYQQDASDSSYWVDEVVYSFGINGYRQKITLGPRV